MPGRDDAEVARAELLFLAVVHDHVQPTRDGVAEVRRLATIGLGDWLHILRPAPLRQKCPATNGTRLRIHQLDLAGAVLEWPDFFRCVQALADHPCHRWTSPIDPAAPPPVGDNLASTIIIVIRRKSVKHERGDRVPGTAEDYSRDPTPTDTLTENRRHTLIGAG